MRRDVSRPLHVKAGDLVVVRLALPSKGNDARLSVWSRVAGWEFSPHTQSSMSQVTKDGRPQFVQPMYARLTEHLPSKVIEFIADEDLEVVVRQEIDVASEPVARARIKRYGTFAQAVRRSLRNAIRSLRGRAALRLG